MEITELSIIMIAVGIAVLLITATVIYAQRPVSEEVDEFQSEQQTGPERDYKFFEPIQFSIFESIKLGFGFGIGLMLASTIGAFFLVMTIGSVFGGMMSLLRVF